MCCAVFLKPAGPGTLTLRSPGPGLGHLPLVPVGDCRSHERLVRAWLTVCEGGGVRGCQPEQTAGLETAFLDCIERTSSPDPGQIQRHACPSRGLCGDTCTPGSCWRHPCPACAQSDAAWDRPESPVLRCYSRLMHRALWNACQALTSVNPVAASPSGHDDYASLVDEASGDPESCSRSHSQEGGWSGL